MTLKSTDVFKKMTPVLEKAGAEIVKKVGAVYLFEIRADKTSDPVYFTVDLKNGNGINNDVYTVYNNTMYRQDH